MKTFKVKSIQHSGFEGTRGTPRIEEKFTSWLGVIVDIDRSSVKGDYFIMKDAFDMSGEHKFQSDDIIVLRVYKKTEFRNMLIVETETTIYTFEEI